MPIVRVVLPHTHNGVHFNPGTDCEMTYDEMTDYTSRVVAERQAFNELPLTKALDETVQQERLAFQAEPEVIIESN